MAEDRLEPAAPDTADVSGLQGRALELALPRLPPAAVPRLSPEQLAAVLPKLSLPQVDTVVGKLTPAQVATLTKEQLRLVIPKLSTNQYDDVVRGLEGGEVETNLHKLSLAQLARLRSDQIGQAVPRMDSSQLDAVVPQLTGPMIARLSPKQFNRVLPQMTSRHLEDTMHEMTLPQLSKVTTEQLAAASVKQLTGSRLAAVLPALPHKGVQKLSASQLAELTPEHLLAGRVKRSQTRKLSPPQLAALKKSKAGMPLPLKVAILAALAYFVKRKSAAPVGWLKDRSGNLVYTVEKGDTLIGISKRYKSNWEKIMGQNAEVVSDPSKIFPGQKLYLRR